MLLALAACTSQEPAEAEPAPCSSEVFESSRFTHCIVDPRSAEIALRLNGADGSPLRSLAALEQSMGDDASHVIAAMNAGMYDDAGQPIGLYVEDGEEITPLNRNDGPGNFHLLPNGVFWGGNGTWHVDTSDHFATLEMATPPPFATQSGPMLCIPISPKTALQHTFETAWVSIRRGGYTSSSATIWSVSAASRGSFATWRKRRMRSIWTARFPLSGPLQPVAAMADRRLAP